MNDGLVIGVWVRERVMPSGSGDAKGLRSTAPSIPRVGSACVPPTPPENSSNSARQPGFTALLSIVEPNGAPKSSKVQHRAST
jgi:hypothetical protein